jgi:putative endonuclease
VVRVRAKDALGAYGERVAVAHLVEQGMQILDRNWRCEIGELDIVARDGGQIVVCEVKTRSSLDFGDPLEGVTARKAARLQRLAVAWASAHERPVAWRDVRVDLIGVLQEGRGAARVEHVRGISP